MNQINKEGFATFLFCKGYDTREVSLFVVEYLLQEVVKTSSSAFHVGKELKRDFDYIQASKAYKTAGYIDPQLKEMAKANLKRLKSMGFSFQELEPYLNA